MLFLSAKYRKSQLKWIARDCRSIITFFEKFHVANYLLLGQHSWQNTAARLSFPVRVSKGYLIWFNFHFLYRLATTCMVSQNPLGTLYRLYPLGKLIEWFNPKTSLGCKSAKANQYSWIIRHNSLLGDGHHEDYCYIFRVSSKSWSLGLPCNWFIDITACACQLLTHYYLPRINV